MTQISEADLRDGLSRYLDEAVDTGTPIVVARTGDKGNVVIVAEADLAGWQETAHLLGNPRNAERLLRSIARADAGDVVSHDLIQPKSTAEA